MQTQQVFASRKVSKGSHTFVCLLDLEIALYTLSVATINFYHCEIAHYSSNSSMDDIITL